MGSGAERIALMGGTFDPVHYGHLACASSALEKLGASKVLFIPAGSPSFKQDQEIAPAKDRLRMCELAVADEPRMEVCGMEVSRPGVTYTIDTVNELIRQNPYADLTFVLGSDTLLTLPKWKGCEELARKVRFAVLMRPGDSAEDVRSFMEEGLFSIDVLEGPLLEVSSSEIRKKVRDGREIWGLAPPRVIEYIIENHLYQTREEL